MAGWVFSGEIRLKGYGGNLLKWFKYKLVTLAFTVASSNHRWNWGQALWLQSKTLCGLSVKLLCMGQAVAVSDHRRVGSSWWQVHHLLSNPLVLLNSPQIGSHNLAQDWVHTLNTYINLSLVTKGSSSIWGTWSLFSADEDALMLSSGDDILCLI